MTTDQCICGHSVWLRHGALAYYAIKQPNMLVQMPLLKEMVKIQHHDYTSVLLYIEESLSKTLVAIATIIN